MVDKQDNACIATQIGQNDKNKTVPPRCQTGEWVETETEANFVYEGPNLVGEYSVNCAYNDFDCAAGITPDTPEKKRKRECLTKCVLVGEGESVVRDRAIEKGLESQWGRNAKILWRRVQKLAGPISWVYSIYECNEECDENECKK